MLYNCSIKNEKFCAYCTTVLKSGPSRSHRFKLGTKRKIKLGNSSLNCPVKSTSILDLGSGPVEKYGRVRSVGL